MTFIDSSAYLAILIPSDSNREKALKLAATVFNGNKNLVTSYAILGEVLTIGSMRFNRQAAIDYVQNIFQSNITLIMENEEILRRGFDIFQKVKDKDVSWVDCYSFAIVEHYHIEKVFSFDKDFRKYSQAKILS